MTLSVNYSLLERVLFEGESGDAEALFQLKKNCIAFDHSRREWFLFSGNYWELDTKQAMFNFIARDLAAEYYEGAAEAKRQGKFAKNGQPLAEIFAKRALELKNRRRIENVLFLADASPRYCIDW